MTKKFTFEQTCETCRIAGFCFPIGLTEQEMRNFDHMVERKKIYQKNDFLYKEGDSFVDICVIRSGNIKTIKKDLDGKDYITGFWFPGEILGLNAIHNEEYLETAIALDTTSVCKLSFVKLQRMSEKIPNLSDKLVRLMSEKLSENYTPRANISADSRFALFLLSISGRLERGGSSMTDFVLTMSRQDIGDYLGLATETISRLFARFQNDGVLEIKNRSIQLKDLKKLQIIACNTK